MGKIVSRKHARVIGHRCKTRGIKIGLAAGCFDVLHIGHVRMLTEARRHVDHLMVALNTDDIVKALKGSSRPRFTLKERMEVIAALGVVSSVVSFSEETPCDLIREVSPRVVIKGLDYMGIEIPEEQVCKDISAMIIYTGDPKTRSSTELITDRRLPE